MLPQSPSLCSSPAFPFYSLSGQSVMESSPATVTVPLSPILVKSNDVLATKIQKIFRGFSDRKAFLPSSSYPLNARLCEDSQTSFMKMAEDGKIDVYLPEGHAVVLKHIVPLKEKETARGNAIKRFQSTHPVRSILKSIEASHLTVPRSMLCKDFLVEERLPIITCPFTSKELYEEKPKLFNEPVKEMVRLFSKINIPYLVTYKYDKEKGLEVTGIRYDNIPFYLTEGKNPKVKFGLIDLQRAGEKSNQKIKLRLAHLSMMFPLHKDVINDEADRLELTYHKEDLIKGADAGLVYLKTIKKPPVDVFSGRSCLPR